MTEEFKYQDNQLYVEDVPMEVLAEQYGTPLYIYSQSHLQTQHRRLTEAMIDVNPLICYSVKCNSNLSVLKTFADLGTGADVVSGGELFRALKAGFPADKIAFAGVGKTVEEVEYAIREGILFFSVESEPELERISECAQRVGQSARIAIRVNPDVDPKTHKYTTTGKKETKFGVDLERAEKAYELAASLEGLELAGMHMHLGSPLADEEPYVEALEKVMPLCLKLKEKYPEFQHIDIGGGLGIPYKPDQPEFDLNAFRDAVVPLLKKLDLKVSMEPGRFLAGNAGVLLTRAQYIKDNPFKKFTIVDAAMTDLIRPPLYEAYHHILPVQHTDETVFGDVVGGVCESSDFLAANRDLPAVQQGDLLAVMSAGAYGFGMSSTYNSRPRAAEVLVNGSNHGLVRERETRDDLIRGEQLPDWMK